MVTFLIGLFCLSLIGLSSVLYARHWEETHGRFMLSSVRPKAGAMLGVGLNFIERRAPFLLREAALRAYAAARLFAKRAMAWALLHTERLLERTLQGLRHTTQARAEGEASAFLREVAEHKKLLQDGSSDTKNAIYEE